MEYIDVLKKVENRILETVLSCQHSEFVPNGSDSRLFSRCFIALERVPFFYITSSAVKLTMVQCKKKIYHHMYFINKLAESNACENS